LNKVVLPAPFGPMIESTFPGAAEKLTPSTATTPPNAMPMSSAARRLTRRLAP
jgi:hypothetical protein